MKRVAVLGCALILVAGFASAQVEAKVVEMDAADGKSEGHWVAFLSRELKEGSPAGHAIVGVGMGEKFDSAFGLVASASKQEAIAVDEAKAKEIHEGEDGAKPTLIIVSVTADQHKIAKEAIAKYSKMKQEDTPANVALNFTQEVLKALEFRRPYRSGLSGAVPTRFLTDIPMLNRKKVTGP